ncbi:hypothetical protein [uncultured Tateyamaria sp.]|uniref:hypothetical protein n=1 Tax=uncultured Tateyamaria sp. TaxID=455651 RepID=UPI00262D9CD3|nr:hypothetical protein [uncultured Tateyamaria sp.]
MSLANLNVWVTALDDPCKISSRTWYINIYNCDGSILRWCDREYAVIPAPCGHRSIRVPPGCYRINAVWSFRIGDGFYYVNHFTDSAVVQACCDQHQCVTLFNPSAHRCGRIFLAAVQDAVQQEAIPNDAAQLAEDGIEQVLKHIPRPARPFELGHLDEIEKRVRAAEEKGGDKDDTGVFPFDD